MNTNIKTTLLLLGAGMLIHASAQGQPDTTMTRNCNQLGRELALRSVEELGFQLDGRMRAELAGLAERICLDFNTLDSSSISDVVSGSTAGNDDAAETDANHESIPGTGEPDNSFFDLKKIAPEDRVRRPGLKRR